MPDLGEKRAVAVIKDGSGGGGFEFRLGQDGLEREATRANGDGEEAGGDKKTSLGVAPPPVPLPLNAERGR